MEEIEYHEDRKLDKMQLLRLAACKYIEEGHHVVLTSDKGGFALPSFRSYCKNC